MISKLAIKNIKYYLKSYAVYFGTIAFNVWEYFILTCLTNGVFLALQSQRTYRILFRTGIKTILIFTIIFICYSASYFLKKRKREIGMYLLMGIPKRKVASLLFCETVFMGMAATVTGIGIGIITMPIAEKLLLQVLGEFSGGGMSWNWILPFNVLLDFLVVFVIVSLINGTSVYRYQLIDLFKAEQKRDREIAVSKWKAFLSVIVLILGYFLLFQAKGSETMHFVPIGLAMTVSGIFLTVGQAVEAGFSKIRNSRLGAENTDVRVVTTSVLYRIRKNTTSWATIALLITASTGAIMTGLALYQSQTRMLEQEHAFSYTYINPGEERQREIENCIAARTKQLASCRIDTISVDVDTDMSGELIENVCSSKIRVFSQSSLKKIEKAIGIRFLSGTLKEGEAMALGISDVLNGQEIYLGDRTDIYKLRITDNHRVLPVRLNKEECTLVVADETFERLKEKETVQAVQCIKIDRELDMADLTMEILRILPVDSGINCITQMEAAAIKLMRGLILLIMFACMTLLTSTGSMLYFKGLSETREDEPGYRLLYCIGADKAHLKKMMAWQIRFMFGLPYIVGSFNTVMLAVWMGEKRILHSISPILVSTAVYAAVYLLYYWFAVREGNSFIRNLRGRNVYEQ